MTVTSIRFTGLLHVGLSMLLASSSIGIGVLTAHAQDKPATIQEVSYIAPSSLGQMLQSSDLVVRARITDAKPNFVGPGDSGIFTELTATVVQQYRARGASVEPGKPIRILQEGGEAQVGAKRLRIEAEFERLSKGKEYLLFLSWNNPVNAYQVNYGPDGAFEVGRGQKLRAMGKSPSALELVDVVVPALPERLQQTLAAQKR